MLIQSVRKQKHPCLVLTDRKSTGTATGSEENIIPAAKFIFSQTSNFFFHLGIHKIDMNAIMVDYAVVASWPRSHHQHHQQHIYSFSPVTRSRRYVLYIALAVSCLVDAVCVFVSVCFSVCACVRLCVVSNRHYGPSVGIIALAI